MGRFSTLLAAIGIASLGVAGGGAFALATASGGSITVCIRHSGGTLYTARSCAKHDKKLSWNKVGPRGLQGPPGVPGTAGVNGTNGTNGSNGATNVVLRISTKSVGPGGSVFGTANCNPGERATGGGAVLDTESSQTQVEGSEPTVSTDEQPKAGEIPDGWETGLFNGTAGTETATFYVVCASP